MSFKANEVKSSCCQEKENKENKDGNIILDGNNKLGLEGEEDEEEEEEEDRINNEYVLYDEEHSSDGEFEEDAEGGNDSSQTYRNTRITILPLSISLKCSDMTLPLKV